MNPALAVLGRTEREIAALLVAGLATPRGGREQMAVLADEVAALKMERLAVELRNLAHEQDPAALANSALTALAMSRKIAERVLPWPEVDVDAGVFFPDEPSLRFVLPDGLPGGDDISALGRLMESGDDLLRARAAVLLLARGEEAIPELSHLAAKATLAVRREAIAALGRLAGPGALRALIGLLGDGGCWRALIQAVVPRGGEAEPLLADALASTEGKKSERVRRLMAAFLLYRLSAYRTLASLLKPTDDDPIVAGLATAAGARAGGDWREPAGELIGRQGSLLYSARSVVALARWEATGDSRQALALLDDGPVNDVRTVVGWMGCAGPLEGPLGERYLPQLAGGRAKDRQRATSALRGLADLTLVPRVAALARAKAIDVEAAMAILGETGGSQAVGALLHLAHECRGEVLMYDKALAGLKNIGDPGVAAVLLDMLPSSPSPTSVEAVLIGLGDGVVDFLAREMHANVGSPLGASLQQILLQMKTRRAKEALKGTDADSVDSLLARLGHSKLGSDAAKELARHGEAVLERLAAVVTSGDLVARLNALAAIGSIKGPNAYELLYAMVENNLSAASTGAPAAECARAVELLPKYEDERTAPLLARALACDSYHVQRQVVAALTKMGHGVVPHVLPSLDSPRPIVRARAVEVLGNLAAVEAQDKVIELLSDGSREVTAAAVVALGKIGAVTRSAQVAEALCLFLDRDTSGWPVQAIDAIAETGQRAAVPFLRRYAQDAPSKNPGFGPYLRNRALNAVKLIEASSPSPGDEGLVGNLKRLFGGN